MTETGKWRYIHKQDAEYVKGCEYSGFWWTNSIPKFQVQLKHTSLAKLYPGIQLAMEHQKPYLFFIVDDVRAKWRKITSPHGDEFYISQYGNDVWSTYDPKKIGSLATNSVSTYYDWNVLPDALKAFIELK